MRRLLAAYSVAYYAAPVMGFAAFQSQESTRDARNYVFLLSVGVGVVRRYLDRIDAPILGLSSEQDPFQPLNDRIDTRLDIFPMVHHWSRLARS